MISKLVLLTLIAVVAVYVLMGTPVLGQPHVTGIQIYEGRSPLSPAPYTLHEQPHQRHEFPTPYATPSRFPGREAVIMGNGQTVLLPKVGQSKSTWWPRLRGLFWGQSCTPAERAAAGLRYR